MLNFHESLRVLECGQSVFYNQRVGDRAQGRATRRQTLSRHDAGYRQRLNASRERSFQFVRSSNGSGRVECDVTGRRQAVRLAGVFRSAIKRFTNMTLSVATHRPIPRERHRLLDHSYPIHGLHSRLCGLTTQIDGSTVRQRVRSRPQNAPPGLMHIWALTFDYAASYCSFPAVYSLGGNRLLLKQSIRCNQNIRIDDAFSPLHGM